MRLAMLTGIEKPMPTLPPVRERIALLMPTTSPDMFTSGPPELPGLMAASVCRKSSKGTWPRGAAFGVDDPGGPRLRQPERRADGQHPVAHPHRVGVAEIGGRVGA